MPEKITLSVIEACVGGYVGHSCIHPDLLKTAEERLFNAREKGVLVDCHVTRRGDDLELIMTHRHGVDEQVRKLSWDTFVAWMEVTNRKGQEIG